MGWPSSHTCFWATYFIAGIILNEVFGACHTITAFVSQNVYSDTFKWGDLNGGHVSLCDMTRRWRNEPWFWYNKQSGLREGMCVICAARVLRTLLPHKCCITPVPSPPPLRSARWISLTWHASKNKSTKIDVLPKDSPVGWVSLPCEVTGVEGLCS